MSSEAFYPTQTQKKRVHGLKIAIGLFMNFVMFLLGERGGESSDVAEKEWWEEESMTRTATD
jgi:hypothetical protein